MSHAILSLLALATSSATMDSNQPDRCLVIEVLYLDLGSCTRCVDTAARVDEALALLAPVLQETGWQACVRKIHVRTEAQAREMRFASSPTVRINGRDVQLDSRESPCSDCGRICGENDIACREWRYRDRWFSSPPRALFVEAIARAISAPSDPSPKEALAENATFTVPENLRRFFAAKEPAGTADGCCAPAAAACCAPASKTEQAAPCCPSSAPLAAKQDCCTSKEGCCGTAK